jgi:hypothetical protein
MYACGFTPHPSTGRSTLSDRCHEYINSFVFMVAVAVVVVVVVVVNNPIPSARA